MSKRMQNILLIAAVIGLMVFPLVSINAALGPDGELEEIFTGADGQAAEVIQQIAPDYTPWFSSIIAPPSVEIESLLFALQAALGAGIIGYYLGYCRGRVKTADESADSNYVA